MGHNTISDDARFMSFTNKPFVFLQGIKIHCTFLKCSDCKSAEMHQCSIYVPLHHPLELFQYYTDEVKMNVSKICTLQRKCVPVPSFPCQQILITCSITISISVTVLYLVIAVNELVVTVPDLVVKSVVVNTVIDSFITLLVTVVKE